MAGLSNISQHMVPDLTVNPVLEARNVPKVTNHRQSSVNVPCEISIDLLSRFLGNFKTVTETKTGGPV